MTRINSLPQPEANEDGTCAYPGCNNIRPKRKRKWCSSECGQLSFWERNWEGLRLIAFVRDKFHCVICNYPVYVKYNTNTYYVPPNVLNPPNVILGSVAMKKEEELQTEYGFSFLKLVKKYGNGIMPHLWWQQWIEHEEKEKNWIYGHYESIPEIIRRADIDHITPIFRGGDPMSIDNLQTLCVNCHKTKNRKDFTDPNQTSLEDIL